MMENHDCFSTFYHDKRHDYFYHDKNHSGRQRTQRRQCRQRRRRIQYLAKVYRWFTLGIDTHRHFRTSKMISAPVRICASF